MPEVDAKPNPGEPKEPRGVLPAGTRLRIYELISVLGQGGFGVTYLARDTTLNRDVAIKEYLPVSLALREGGETVMPRSTATAADFLHGRERFLEEARTLARLEHLPSIVRVMDFLEANGTAYMVMALARGETLAARLERDGSLAPQVVERMLPPLLEGLEEVHAAHFIHRDIKPANLLIDQRGVPTLIDFGAARAAMAGRTGAMTAIFTPGYAAAEQFTSAEQGPWTDIYGLSATLYHAITGRPPLSAADRMLDDRYVPVGRVAPSGFGPGLLSGIDAGLKVRASERPQSVAEWRTSFEKASSTSATVAMPRRETAKTARFRKPLSPRRQRQALWASIVASVVLVVTAGYFGRGIFVGTAVQSLTAEELSRALEQRRQADALAAEKKKLEEEAQHQAAADAEAKSKADEELAAAQQQRMKAEEELARLKAEMEGRRKMAEEARQKAAVEAQRALDEAAKQNMAEAEMAALRKADEEVRSRTAAEAAAKRTADEEAQRRAEAEAAASRAAVEEAQKKATAEAEAKRLADETLAKAQAEREQADTEAKLKAEAQAKQLAEAQAREKVAAQAKARADAEAQAKAEAEAEKKAAEAGENDLRLTTLDRQHLQVALTSLGFDTRGIDGAFGSRSREMITAWQKARNQLATGFLNASQQQGLLKEGASAIAKYDEDQKRIDEAKKAEAEARKRAEEEKQKAANVWKSPSTPQTEEERIQENAKTDALLQMLIKKPQKP